MRLTYSLINSHFILQGPFHNLHGAPVHVANFRNAGSQTFFVGHILIDRTSL